MIAFACSSVSPCFRSATSNRRSSFFSAKYASRSACPPRAKCRGWGREASARASLLSNISTSALRDRAWFLRPFSGAYPFVFRMIRPMSHSCSSFICRPIAKRLSLYLPSCLLHISAILEMERLVVRCCCFPSTRIQHGARSSHRSGSYRSESFLFVFFGPEYT